MKLALATLALVSLGACSAATPVVAPVAAPAPIAAPVACEHEDGSGPTQVLPCFWQADVAGNGIGYSFTVTEGQGDGVLCYTYADPKAQRKFGECAQVN